MGTKKITINLNYSNSSVRLDRAVSYAWDTEKNHSLNEDIHVILRYNR